MRGGKGGGREGERNFFFSSFSSLFCWPRRVKGKKEKKREEKRKKEMEGRSTCRGAGRLFIHQLLLLNLPFFPGRSRSKGKRGEKGEGRERKREGERGADAPPAPCNNYLSHILSPFPLPILADVRGGEREEGGEGEEKGRGDARRGQGLPNSTLSLTRSLASPREERERPRASINSSTRLSHLPHPYILPSPSIFAIRGEKGKKGEKKEKHVKSSGDLIITICLSSPIPSL